MKYLMEHEAGFDAQSLGYPSVQGCHAICLVAQEGMFGLHNYGGSDPARFQDRATRFRNFVLANTGNAMPNVWHLYGASFVGNNQRGYPGPAAPAARWRQELEAFAAQFNYAGPISGCDLAAWLPGANVSAYVEYNLLGQGCSISIKAWDVVNQNVVWVNNPNGADLRQIVGQVQNQQVVAAVDRANMMNVVPVVVRP
jgi:hypothetical protein